MAQRLKRFLVLLLALPFIAATCQGTETGNPQFNPGAEGCPTASKNATGDDEILDDLILGVCQRIVACGVSTTIDTCVTALNGTDGDAMTDEFGLSAGTTIGELRASLISGAVTSLAAAADDCETDIGAVVCADVTTNVSSGDFSGVENVIPDSCVNVFVSSADAGEAPSSDCP